MKDFAKEAPASRAEINAALVSHSHKLYPLRKAIVEWLADDKKGAKKAWLKTP